MNGTISNGIGQIPAKTMGATSSIPLEEHIKENFALVTSEIVLRSRKVVLACVNFCGRRVFGNLRTNERPATARTTLKLVMLFGSPSIAWTCSQRYSTSSVARSCELAGDCELRGWPGSRDQSRKTDLRNFEGVPRSCWSWKLPRRVSCVHAESGQCHLRNANRSEELHGENVARAHNAAALRVRSVLMSTPVWMGT